MEATLTKKSLTGGEWLIKETHSSDVFIPEQWTEEQLMIKNMCNDFIEQEVWPLLDRLDDMEEGLMESVMDKAAEQGILGITIPEEYNGFGKKFVTGMLATEATGWGHSFSVAMSAHTGIGTLPILYYGNEEQKAKYIPKLASGEWKASYALTEPGAGSDANSGKTSAKLNEAGTHYVINGEKIWITNAGFADVFIVFAKIDDDKNHSAFIIEKGFGGIDLNPEEKKMGIKGSSTRQVFFNDCEVPVENLLSERGNGFKIAVNILNIGRIKLAGAAVGGMKKCTERSVAYANERNQFGQPIANYGAIKYKLAEQAIKTFVSESATYRASQNIEDRINDLVEEGMNKEQALLKGTEQFAIECAIMKFFASEELDYVVDEGVQIYGGMGYSAEMPMERAYRDARINRIFEGTNEINRMLTVDMTLKKAMKGQLDLMTPAKKVQNELMSIPSFDEPDDTLFAKEKEYLSNFKKCCLMVAGAAAQKLMMELAKEQEILMNVADIMAWIYSSESALLRVEKLVGIKGEEACAELIDRVRVCIYDAADKINVAAKNAINSFADGDEQRMMLMGVKRFTKVEPFNTKNARRRIADKMIEENKYCY